MPRSLESDLQYTPVIRPRASYIGSADGRVPTSAEIDHAQLWKEPNRADSRQPEFSQKLPTLLVLLGGLGAVTLVHGPPVLGGSGSGGNRGNRLWAVSPREKGKSRPDGSDLRLTRPPPGTQAVEDHTPFGIEGVGVGDLHEIEAVTHHATATHNFHLIAVLFGGSTPRSDWSGGSKGTTSSCRRVARGPCRASRTENRTRWG